MFKQTFILTLFLYHMIMTSNAAFSSIGEIIEQVKILENSDLIIISTNLSSKPFKSVLSQLENIDKTVYNVKDWIDQEQRIVSKIKCPVFQAYKNQAKNIETELSKGMYFRKLLLKPGLRNQMFLFILDEKSLENTLEFFHILYIRCKQFIDVGYLKQINRFLFLTNNHPETNLVLENSLIQQHCRTACLEVIEKHFAIYRKMGSSDTILTDVTVDNYKMIFALPTSYNGVIVNTAAYAYAHLISLARTPNVKGITKIGPFWGILIEQLQYAMDGLKFNVSIISPPPIDWGHVKKINGSWSGSIGRLVTGKIDLFYGNVFSHDRNQVMKCIGPVYLGGLTFAAPLPTQLTSFVSFLSPLNNYVWFITLFTWLATGFSIFFTAKYESKVTSARSDVQLQFWSNAAECCRYCFGVLLGEYTSPTMHMKTSSMYSLRILLATWSLASLVLSCSYAGSLKAHLTKPTQSSPIDSLQAIIDSPYPWAILDDGEEEIRMIEHSKDPVISQIWNKQQKVTLTRPVNLKPVLEGKQIIIEWEDALAGIVYRRFSTLGSGKPLIHVSKKHIFSAKIWSYGIKKMSPWSEQMEMLAQRALETGLYAEWNTKVWRKQKEILTDIEPLDTDGQSLVTPLTVKDLAGTMLLLAAALTLAAMVGAKEILVDSCSLLKVKSK